MSDEFQFGQHAKRPARLGDPAQKHASRSLGPKLVWIAAGLVVAAVVAFVFLRSADEAGRQIGDANEHAVSQIDEAHDVAAQATMSRAVVVALGLHAESGSFTTDLATLSAFDPGLHFTSGASKDAMSISYAADATRFGAAVRSESGTCWWARIDASGVTTYGSGTPCTGSAALAASAVSW